VCVRARIQLHTSSYLSCHQPRYQANHQLSNHASNHANHRATTSASPVLLLFKAADSPWRHPRRKPRLPGLPAVPSGTAPIVAATCTAARPRPPAAGWRERASSAAACGLVVAGMHVLVAHQTSHQHPPKHLPKPNTKPTVSTHLWPHAPAPSAPAAALPPLPGRHVP
jgi:hypothetical protein